MIIYDGWTETPEVSRARRARLDALHEQWKQATENAEIAEWLDSAPIRSTAFDADIRFNPALNGGVRLGGSPTKYDFTPIPSDMPIIDLETIKEIHF